jgi:hypothetical protein
MCVYMRGGDSDVCVYERRRVQYVREGPLSTLPLSTLPIYSQLYKGHLAGKFMFKRGGGVEEREKETEREREKEREGWDVCVGGGGGREGAREWE